MQTLDPFFDQQWSEALESSLGTIDEVREIQSENRPAIKVFYFEDLPETGTLTAVTCGLSCASHPDWKHGKPELIVSLDTTDRSWGMAVGYFASAFFNEKRFSYGDLFQLDDPFSSESEMNAFFVFAPSFLDQEQATFQLPDRTIHLTGMYPLYNAEIELYQRIGLKEFWHADGFELYNPNRMKIRVD
ncbi:suppressor of fused domain protein [uncultured Gimesia sp.]|uniref:suppressor of fused domain protein n=1 Tax=uncultured Gimesia sp. TaxID=1678688 RepID=UPI0030DBD5F9|tara:strand:- start:1255 stop:1818 length:564 start_codon:yes stop_codon:yes gene_type:complete